jgi:hypothetical protein
MKLYYMVLASLQVNFGIVSNFSEVTIDMSPVLPNSLESYSLSRSMSKLPFRQKGEKPSVVKTLLVTYRYISIT